MDAFERQQLQERTFEEVRRMLEEGDIHYLMGFNRSGLMGALEDELRFLGLYSREDRESPAFIHALLEERLDAWYDRYLRPRVQETQQNPATVVHIEKTPWVVFFTAGADALKDERTEYHDFGPLQVKRIPA
jgi:hypothetical protein